MARVTCYQPAISRPIISALHHQAKHQRIPMTRLIDHLLRESLDGTPGWQKASEDWPELTATPRQDQSDD